MDLLWRDAYPATHDLRDSKLGQGGCGVIVAIHLDYESALLQEPAELCYKISDTGEKVSVRCFWVRSRAWKRPSSIGCSIRVASLDSAYLSTKKTDLSSDIH